MTQTGSLIGPLSLQKSSTLPIMLCCFIMIGPFCLSCKWTSTSDTRSRINITCFMVTIPFLGTFKRTCPSLRFSIFWLFKFGPPGSLSKIIRTPLCFFTSFYLSPKPSTPFTESTGELFYTSYTTSRTDIQEPRWYEFSIMCFPLSFIGLL